MDKKSGPHALTFVDTSMRAAEKKRLEEMYRRVVDTGEVPLLEELKKRVGRLYYSAEEPFGLIRLVDASPEGGYVLVQRLTDQNMIPLSRLNELRDKQEHKEFVKEHFEVPQAEVADKLKQLANSRLNVLYHVLQNGQCQLLGVHPNVPSTDVPTMQ